MSDRVLYIDDEDDIREVAEMALELDPGFEVRTCASGQEGLAAAREWQPRLILLDVMMPELDGPGVLERLRQDPATAAIPVVFITARTQAHEVERLRGLGARGVLAKPFDAMALAGQVRALLDG
ncbi:response regulator [Sphingopyxis sp. KK2]|uniref:response regulator n=1 Tax=Sphingopyxis sp. KK2 TaxID=1855727 RepID=UPI00097E5AA7|nr:response regulator [Sphingopyxis sp. KK2]